MKIALLGDSIRLLGYGPEIPKLLGDTFQVYAPDDNCRFAKYTLRGMYDWWDDMTGCRIVHWNNGLWDLCDYFGDGLLTSEDEYLHNILRIADILTSRHEKVIFATTTPVTERHPHIKNADVERYNALVTPNLREKGVIINDLYSALAPDIDRYIRQDDNIHLSDEGVGVCSRMVADVIRKAAAELEV